MKSNTLTKFCSIIFIMVSSSGIKAQLLNDTLPAPAAALISLSSNSKGSSIPSMDSAQRNAIATPATGFSIYNTSINAVEVYNGTQWFSTVHYIGEIYGGGIVYFVYDNGQHGLIASTADQSSGMPWSVRYGITGAVANGVGAGLKNTCIIVAVESVYQVRTYAAQLCNQYSVVVAGVTYGDWYLPSKYELNLLYIQKAIVGNFTNGKYWSSSEDVFSTGAFLEDFSNGTESPIDKLQTYNLRAIRAF